MERGSGLGTAIVGTLHTFHPSLTRTRLRFAVLQGPTLTAWTGGTTALAVGLACDVPAVAVLGWLALGLSAGLLSANLVASVAVAPRPLSLPARLVTLAQGFLLAGVTVGTIGALHGRRPRRTASRRACAHLASADALRTPGAAALMLVYAVLGAHVLVLAERALSRPRQRRPLV